MNAGRELDAMVAEKVMGLNIEMYQTMPPRPAIAVDGRLQYLVGREPLEFADVPRYSADIAAAWAIVEKFSNMGLFRRHYGKEAVNPGTRWCAYLAEEINDRYDLEAEAATAPLAICLCALKAVESRVAISRPPAAARGD